VTVLRDGRTVLCGEPIAQVDRSRLVEAMIGRAERPALARQHKPNLDQPRLQLDHVSSSLGHRDVSLAAHSGEVLGLYGLVGSGRTELARLIMGEGRVTSGTITANGGPVGRHSVRDSIKRLGIGYVSEDRKAEGVILGLSVRRNIAITVWDTIAHTMGFLRRADETRVATPLTDKLEIRTPTLDQLVENLSGGNQQKVAIAKWLAASVSVLIMDEPTVGVDIKAKAYIHELINGLADNGKSIILISSDMQEMIALADRIAVFSEFSIVDIFENDRRYDTASRRIMSSIQDQMQVAPLAASVAT
jgi:ribose transport system ATP-binding protein